MRPPMNAKTSQGVKEQQATILSMEHHYSGPLPPSQEFKAYGEVMKDAPERILEMAEKEQEHRHQRENFDMKMQFVDNILGMLLGIVIVVACLWLAYILGIEDHDWLAGVFVTIATTFAAIFVLRKIPKNDK